MNKSDLINVVANSAEISKVAASRAVEDMTEAMTKALKKGDQITLTGFGSFTVRNRAARMGRNPQTGEQIQVRASKRPIFRAGKALKDAIQ